ncbi:MAG: peptidase M14 [Rhizobiales bacterium]|nr:peptidase M14 [Hyphomicrobiales bacterium]
MREDLISIAGDTPGVTWSLRVLRFSGREPDAVPRVYLQGALHADELPGTVALHALAPLLRRAEAEGRLVGDVVMVPAANPIGTAQWLHTRNEGRFEAGSMRNFNRGHLLIDAAGSRASALAMERAEDGSRPAVERLKARLLAEALAADIVLDLHCDSEGLPYVYLHASLWPGARDLAVAIGARAVLLWSDDSDAAFEEAALHPHLYAQAAGLEVSGRHPVLSSTVEYRGQGDVSPELAQSDAAGLMAFLEARGVVVPDRSKGAARALEFDGPVVPLANVEMMPAPVGGAILYHVEPGDRVLAGDALATIITAPGTEKGEHVVRAPQDGFILTRRMHRHTRRGDDLLKLLASGKSATSRPGALEV